MSEFEAGPDNELFDDAEARAKADENRYSVPTSLFRTILDEAIIHAALPARRDALAASRPWRPLGPRNVGGRIRCLAQDPITPTTLYAGSGQGGMWKTTDHGDTWQSMDDFRPPNPPNNVRQSLPVGAIGISRSHPQILYVGTGEPIVNKFNYDYKVSGAGLFWSQDGGQTMNRIDHPDVLTGTIAAPSFERIIVDPWEPRRLWLASPTRGLWRGSPSGALPTPPSFSQDVIDAVGAPTTATLQDASDVVIYFGDPAKPPPANYTIYVALRGSGIYKAKFNRAANNYTVGAGGKRWQRLTSDKFPATDPNPDKIDDDKFHRVKLAMCQGYPQYIYAIFALSDNRASNVFISKDFGNTWDKSESRSGDKGKQAWYDLVLEVHPKDPRIIVTGSVDLFRSVDGGKHWQKIIDWYQYDEGDRAQHADQHACVFDLLDSRTLWATNDGGISRSHNLGINWRKRSHGILATQFNDITQHPNFHSVLGGGLQDNGTWLSYGGPTWYNLYGGDGGDIGFEPNSIRAFHVTTQNGVRQARVRQSDDFVWLYKNPLADRGANQKMRTEILGSGSGFASEHKSTFYAVLEHHPTKTHQALIGRKKAAYRTMDGKKFTLLPLGTFAEFRPVGNTSDYYIPEVSALAYGPGGSVDTLWWVATSRGELYRTTNGGTGWQEVAPAAANGSWIAQIAIHPVSPQIIAIAIADDPGRVFISGDQGAHWQEISGRHANALSANATDLLTSSPILAAAFDPATPNPAAGPHTLYVGTLAGIYAIRNAVAPTAAPGGLLFAPQWRTLNTGMPLVQIYDLTTVRYVLPGGIIKNVLRTATFGRGIYECELDGAPAVRLLIRDHIADDGKTYPAASTLSEDPRVPPGETFTRFNSVDLRIDTPPYRDFGPVLDGAEFDEDFVTAPKLIGGEINVIYLQLHNMGAADADPVTVHLFYADTIGSPGQAPDLTAAFWTGFPAGAAPWKLAATSTVNHLQPSQPQVHPIRWLVPADAGKEVALLAICTHANDDLRTHLSDGSARPAASPTPPLVVDPRKANPLLDGERRVALRIFPVDIYTPDPYTRDGMDDHGLGAVAWGCRSRDIVVMDKAAATAMADINVALKDLGAKRREDALKKTLDHRIFVRVHNRRKLSISNVAVKLYAFSLTQLTQPGSWQLLGDVKIAAINAESWLFSPPVNFDKPADPAASLDHKVWLLAAIIDLTDPTGPDDKAPDHTKISTIKAFWQFFLEGEQSNNTALTTVPWAP